MFVLDFEGWTFVLDFEGFVLDFEGWALVLGFGGFVLDLGALVLGFWGWGLVLDFKGIDPNPVRNIRHLILFCWYLLPTGYHILALYWPPTVMAETSTGPLARKLVYVTIYVS